MRYLRYAFLAALAIVLISVAMANRDLVTVNLLTDDMAGLIGLQNSVSLPLFVVIFISIVAGILIGFVWEWFREHKHRVEATVNRKEKERLAKEVSQIRMSKDKPKDDVLALLEQ